MCWSFNTPSWLFLWYSVPNANFGVMYSNFLQSAFLPQESNFGMSFAFARHLKFATRAVTSHLGAWRHYPSPRRRACCKGSLDAMLPKAFIQDSIGKHFDNLCWKICDFPFVVGKLCKLDRLPLILNTFQHPCCNFERSGWVQWMF